MTTNVHKQRYNTLKRWLQMSTNSFNTLIISKIFNKSNFIDSTDNYKIEWQMCVILFWVSICYLFGIILYFLFPIEPYGIFYKYMNAAHAVGIVTLLLTYIKEKISIRTALSAFLVLCAVEITVEMIYQAMNDGNAAPLNISMNMTLLTFIASISALTYVRRLCLWVSIIAITAYLTGAYISECKVIIDYSYIIVIAFISLMLVAGHLSRAFKMLSEQNDAYKEEQSQMLDYMQLTKEQWKEMMEALRINNKRIPTGQTDKIMGLMDERLKQRLTYEAKELLKKEQHNSDILLSKHPSLTHAEVKVATGIIRGMTTSEIGSTLNIASSTVTTLRCRIRNKCGIDRNTNLQSYLCNLVNEKEETDE